jgi:signal peptidase I
VAGIGGFCQDRPVKRLLSLLVVPLLVAGCSGPAAEEQEEKTETYTQSGVSMEPTIKAGQVITARSVGSGYQPKAGDIVLFRGDGGAWGASDLPLLKRVVAVGGTTIACCDVAGRITVDGTPVDEPYVTRNSPLDVPPNPSACASRRFGPVAVPAGSVFLMGDNRAASNDSRCAGPIAASGVFAVMTG